MNASSTPLTVTVPLLNPNEPEGILAALHVHEGQQVRQGDPLFTLETTKSTADVPAEQDGYVVGLRLEEGAQVRAGIVFCYLAASPEQPPPSSARVADSRMGSAALAAELAEDQPIPAGLRITRPALALARSLSLDLNILPLDRLITETVLKDLIPHQKESTASALAVEPFDPTALVIYGGGGHGKSLIDLVRLLRVYRLVGVIDDGLAPGSEIMGIPILGGAQALAGLHAHGVHLAVNAVGGISSLQTRLRVFQILADAGFACPPLVHPSAVVEASAALAAGVQVFAHAYVGSDARVGFGAIVNTGAILSHDCVLDEYANISPGAILAGEVKIGAGALVGMGVTINLQVQVGPHARIGNGATVKAHVPENTVVRAGSIWPA